MPLLGKRLDQMRQGMRCPFDQAHRIPFGLQQRLQIPLQARIRHRCLLPPASGFAHAMRNELLTYSKQG